MTEMLNVKMFEFIITIYENGCISPQSDRRLAIIDIDESKGLVDLWEHFFVAIVSIHRNGY